MPFSRRTRTAASMSPFVSWSARLQSIIGAPVWSRSSFTSAAEISAIGRGLLRDRLVARRQTLLVALGGGLLAPGGPAPSCGGPAEGPPRPPPVSPRQPVVQRAPA